MDNLLDLPNRALSWVGEKFIDNPYKDPFKKKVWEDIMGDEDYRMLPYEDVKGHRTTGIGHLGDDPRNVKQGLLGFIDKSITTPSEAESLSAMDIDDKIADARSFLGPAVYDNLSEEAKLAVISMNFRGDLRGSPKTADLIRQGNMKAAAIELLDNDDYRKGIARLRFEKNARRLQM
tara:strand:+ start:41 stop:571 length:531 start_codon:yes stop_codon:yes gene_type:complete